MVLIQLQFTTLIPNSFLNNLLPQRNTPTRELQQQPRSDALVAPDELQHLLEVVAQRESQEGRRKRGGGERSGDSIGGADNWAALRQDGLCGE